MTLFFRNTRAVELTDAGKRFRNFAMETLAGLERVKLDPSGLGADLKGEISLYGSVTACLAILPEVLGRFRQGYPNIHIKLHTGDAASAVDSVINGECDISVAALPENLPRSLVFKKITETPLVFVAPSFPWGAGEMLEKPEIPWADIPLILSEKGLARKRVDSWFRNKGIRPFIYAQVSGNEAILAMVGLGCGVGVVPELVIEKSPVKERVRKIEVSPLLDPYIVGVCSKKGILSSPLVKAFWETV